MLCYDIRYELESLPFDGEIDLPISGSDLKQKDKWENILKQVNKNLGLCVPIKKENSLRTTSKTEQNEVSETVSAFAYEVNEKIIRVCVMFKAKDIEISDVVDLISEKIFKGIDSVSVNKRSLSDITTERFCDCLRDCAESDIVDYPKIRRFEERFNIDYRDNNQFNVNETIFGSENIRYKTIYNEAKEIIGDQSLLDEIDRIYNPENVRGFYGHPVHYRISAGTKDAALDIAHVLLRALYGVGRLRGSRMTYISGITDCCYDESDFTHVLEAAQGTTALIEMNGRCEEDTNYASGYEQTVEFISHELRKYQRNTLIIFIDIVSKPGFGKKLMNHVSDDIEIIDLKEGVGEFDQAKTYLKKLMMESNLSDFVTADIDQFLSEQKTFSVTDVYDIFNKWNRECLKNQVYKSYHTCNAMIVKKEERKAAYDELMKLVGLVEVKQIVNQIISAHKIQLMRSKMNLKKENSSLHMVFTGNPGSAKTTVARLLARTLKEEGVLEVGEFVECGRDDLVAKYVGWTAKTVKQKFLQAKGGVLFIDEAYSLVDGSNSFGDEAINTIVQEMENHRDDVIVIFAGYPDKMELFLEKNEGLRSRIAFHVNFPDYNENELLKILSLMCDEKGYKISKRVKEKCLNIFKTASRIPEFGNGRYVRNLLEQATLKQSSRLIKQYEGKEIKKNNLLVLKEDDFDVNVVAGCKKEYKIGFYR